MQGTGFRATTNRTTQWRFTSRRTDVKTAHQTTGSNSKAPFSLKVHRGDGMALLAMNWRNGKPPRTFVGFAIEFREPGNQRFQPIRNRIGFPGQRKTPNDPPVDSTERSEERRVGKECRSRW